MGSEYFSNHLWGVRCPDDALESEIAAYCALWEGDADFGFDDTTTGLDAFTEAVDEEEAAEILKLVLADRAADAGGENGPDLDKAIDRRYRGRLTQAFAAKGMLIPPDACIVWTGSPDARPGVSDTDPDCVIIGYGMLGHDPLKPLNVSGNFANEAQHFEWVSASG